MECTSSSVVIPEMTTRILGKNSFCQGEGMDENGIVTRDLNYFSYFCIFK